MSVSGDRWGASPPWPLEMYGDETVRDLPIIFITGHGDVPMTVRAMKAGAVEFLTKPFGDEALLSAIAGALERSRAALERVQRWA